MVKLWFPKPSLVVRVYHPVIKNLVAQRLEQLAVNQKVTGSNPV